MKGKERDSYRTEKQAHTLTNKHAGLNLNA